MNQLIRGVITSVAVASVLLLTACSSGGSSDPDRTPAAIEVDEGPLTVDVQLSRGLLDPGGNLTDEELIAGAADKGFSAVVDGDTVVYTMTKAQHQQMLEELRTSARKSVDDLVADESNSITGVEFDDGQTSFRVSVDAARYTPLESFLVLGFYISGAFYQQVAGASPDDVDVIVEFVDDATGEVLNTGSYQEMRANLQQ